MEIEVSSGVVATIVGHAATARPREACGLLFGKGDVIDSATRCANVHPQPETHFEIDPQALIDAHRAARSGGPPVIGYWHSHPSGPPRPSATDRKQATGDGRVWAIVAFDRSKGRVGWWRDTPCGFEPLSYRASHG
ncbi:Mov34/MPN/PAD-1 family protein [Tsuneonella sp. SYSU-LHT278]|uniref:Mov34/MPN/PAD-1 family protein n=1 Tax=Tsuneonella sediminis TaxID=3416089 RepID=UPI003F78D006